VKPDLLDPSLYSGDPEPAYAWLREQAPAYWDEANKLWGVSRHADVVAIERNPSLYSSATGSRPHQNSSFSMINKDDPAHQEQRRLVYRRFTPRAVSRHEARVRELVTMLIDGVASRGECEVVSELAAPLPAMVICELIGWDLEMWPKCREWSEVTMAGAGLLPDARTGSAMMQAVQDFSLHAMDLIEKRRAQPGDDLVSVWVGAGDLMDTGEVIQETLLLLDGGAETTRSVIGATVLALIRHPEQRRRLLDDPSMIRATATDEFIRWATPILNMRRTATADHELHGERVRAGDELLLMYGSANRDPEAFDRPQEFDVGREHNPHIAFGLGTHFCLGASLARLEIRIVFEELLRRLPDFRLAPGAEPEFAPSFFARTLRDLHIEFTPDRGR
jgi:cytochrome P450 family 142 subfamily A polypeptide 1